MIYTKRLLLLILALSALWINGREAWGLELKEGESKGEMAPRWHDLFLDVGKVLASPLQWDASSVLQAGIVSAGTLALFFVDENIHHLRHEQENLFAQQLSPYARLLGEGASALAIAGGLGLGGLVFNHEKIKRMAIEELQAAVGVALSVEALKMVLHRRRPNEEKGPFSFLGPSLNKSSRSFPSGHTTLAFSTATVIASEVGGIFISTLCYGVAALTGLSRIIDDKHWASDVFFGSILGIVIGKAAVKLHAKRRTSFQLLSGAKGEDLLMAVQMEI